MSRLKQVALFMVASLFASISQSAIVTWQFKDVVFADGGTATGSFTLDDSAPGFIRHYEINTSGTSIFPAQEYNLANLAGSIADIVHIYQFHFTNATSHFAITFEQGQFFDAGGLTVRVPPLGQVVATDLSNPQNYEFLYATTQQLRNIIGGSVIAVSGPEPSAYIVLVVGLVGLLLIRRRM